MTRPRGYGGIRVWKTAACIPKHPTGGEWFWQKESGIDGGVVLSSLCSLVSPTISLSKTAFFHSLLSAFSWLFPLWCGVLLLSLSPWLSPYISLLDYLKLLFIYNCPMHQQHRPRDPTTSSSFLIWSTPSRLGFVYKIWSGRGIFESFWRGWDRWVGGFEVRVGWAWDMVSQPACACLDTYTVYHKRQLGCLRK